MDIDVGDLGLSSFDSKIHEKDVPHPSAMVLISISRQHRSTRGFGGGTCGA
jgi:hypothetical protein